MGVGDAMTVPAVFLDRDGVINFATVREGKPYPPSSLRELKIIPGVPEALAKLRAAGFKLIVVTNRPDVGRGQTPLSVVAEIHDYLMNVLPLDDIRACYHGGEEDCSCRKPKPGLIVNAAMDFGVDLGESFMVGDRWRDMDAGAAAGCRTILIDMGYRERPPRVPPDYVCRSLAEAAAWILNRGGCE